MREPSESKLGSKVKQLDTLLAGSIFKGDSVTTPAKHLINNFKKKPKGDEAKRDSKRHQKRWLLKSKSYSSDYVKLIKNSITAHGIIYAGQHVKTMLPPITNDSMIIDAVVQEYISLLNPANKHKTRLVVDADKKLYGLLTLYINNLKNFASLVPQYQAQLASGGVTKEMSAQYNFLFLYKLLMKQTHHIAITRESFARACVLMERLFIEDLHLNNIAIGGDDHSRIMLFDVEHALGRMQVGSYLSRLKAQEFQGIEHQPSAKAVNLFRLDVDYSHYDIIQQQSLFKEGSGAVEYNRFQHEVNKALLKEILCPSKMITRLVDSQRLPFDDNNIFKSISEFLIQSRDALEEHLLSRSEFTAYLLGEHVKTDFVALIEEWRIALTDRPYLLDSDIDTELLAIADKYLSLLHNLADLRVRKYIEGLPAVPDEKEQEGALAQLQELYKNHSGKAFVEKRKKPLLLAAKSYLSICTKPWFKPREGFCKDVIKVIAKTPSFLHKFLLKALYTNNDAAVKQLLPLYIKKNGVNAIDQFGRSMVHYAVMTENNVALNILINRRVSFDPQTSPFPHIWLDIYFRSNRTNVIPTLFERGFTDSFQDRPYLGIAYEAWETRQVDFVNRVQRDGFVKVLNRAFAANDVTTVSQMSLLKNGRGKVNLQASYESERSKESSDYFKTCL